MHQRDKALRLNFHTVLQMDASAANTFFQCGANPAGKVFEVQLHLGLDLLGKCREFGAEESRNADRTIVAPDTLFPMVHVQLEALQRLGNALV